MPIARFAFGAFVVVFLSLVVWLMALMVYEGWVNAECRHLGREYGRVSFFAEASCSIERRATPVTEPLERVRGGL